MHKLRKSQLISSKPNSRKDASVKTLNGHVYTLTNARYTYSLYISRMYYERLKLHTWTMHKLYIAAE